MLSRRTLLKTSAGLLTVGVVQAIGFPRASGQEAGEVTIPLSSFGWSGWEGASGAFSYPPVAEEFEATLTVEALRPNHVYEVRLVTFDPAGGRTVTKGALSTDTAGKATAKVRTNNLAEAELPMFQVHVFIVDPEETDPPQRAPEITGVGQGAPLVCLYPAGFRVQRSFHKGDPYA